MTEYAKILPFGGKPAPKPSPGVVFEDLERQIQMDALSADISQQACLVDRVVDAYQQVRFEKAKFIVALLNPLFFQKALESLEGAKLAVLNCWAFGDGLFFYRHMVGCQIGKYSQDILLKEQLTEPQLLQIAMKLQNSVRWAEKVLQGARVK